MWGRVYCDQRREWNPSLLRSADGVKKIAYKLRTRDTVTVTCSRKYYPEVCVMSQLGKRYRCSVCGTEILCTKAGEGKPVCCEKEMEIQEPKPLPSSD